jgi:hypothetical protein
VLIVRDRPLEAAGRSTGREFHEVHQRSSCVGIDPAIVQKPHDAFKAFMDDARVKAAMEKHLMPPRYADPKGYLEIVQQSRPSKQKA